MSDDREALERGAQDADEQFTAKPVGKPVQACPAKPNAPLVVCVVSVTFRSDHVNGSEKLLRKEAKAKLKINKKPVVSEWGSEGSTPFKKPEWDAARGGPADSHPISQTKSTPVKVDVTFRFTKVPRGTGILSRVTGTSKLAALNFDKPLVPGAFEQGNVIMVSDGEVVTIRDLVASGPLPDHVALISAATIDWTVEVSNTTGVAGQTGPHTIYVTFGEPKGKVQFSVNKNNRQTFDELGTEQVVTEKRLHYAVTAAQGKGASDEQECVDAIFKRLKDLGVGYTLHVNWTPKGTTNDTGCDPHPDLYHYLWLCNAKLALGECHNIAAGFMLACRILGTKEPMKVAYMHPWPSRLEAPGYPKRGDQLQGKLDIPFKRAYAQGMQVNHVLAFRDGRGELNAFEGVVKYRRGLYAIGDAIFDRHQADVGGQSSDDLNTSTYFAERDVAKDAIRPDPASMKPNKGSMDLQFVDLDLQPEPGPASFQYPFVQEKAEVKPRGVVEFKPGTFKWEE